MPQITTIRVVRSRKVQPEQFGSAGAEVEQFGTVLEGEDPMVVARNMLIDSRMLVYENLGLSLPAHIVDALAERDTPTETATVEIATGDKPKPRGRPKGSTNKKKDEAAAAETAAPAATTASDADDIPGDAEPNIRTNPENRVNPEDNEVPGDDDGVPGDDNQPADAAPEQDMTAEGLFKFINASITDNKLTVMQAKKMQAEMKVARVRDLNTPEKVAEAKAMIEGFIAENEAS